jgi:hypothetical protein
MRLPLKYSLNWDEFWECEYDILQFVVLTSPVVNSTLKCSQNLDKFCLKEKIYLEFTITPSDIASMAPTGPQNRSGFCEGVQSKIEVLHDTCRYSPVVRGHCEVMYYGYSVSKLDPNHSRRWDRFARGGYHEYKHFGSFMLRSEKYAKYLTCKRR